MAMPLIQTALSAGEISPELYGEVDLKKFSAAATTLRNFIVNYRGGALSRAGLAFVGRCKQPATRPPPRAIPFQFSITQGYILEFGDNYLRFVFQGGYVLENPVSITGAVNADPCQINVAGTPFANGDWVFAAGIGGMTQLNGNTYIVANAAAGSFTLKDLDGNDVDATLYGVWTGGGTFSRLYTISTPYVAEDLPYLKYSQSADVMSLTCSNPTNLNEYPPYDLKRLAAIDWVLEEVDFDPVISPPVGVSAVANTQAPKAGINASFAYCVTAVDTDGNESIASAIATCHGADLQVEAGTNTITWPFVAGAKYYNVYRASPSVDTVQGEDSTVYTPNPVPPGSVFGFSGSTYGCQFVDSNPATDLSQVPPVHRNPFARGQILAVEITSGGTGLDTVTWSITTAAGVDFNGDPAVVGGSLGGFPITNNGRNYEPGDSIAFNGAGFATGAIEFGATNPSANDTITLNGVVWTFVSAITGDNQTIIGGALSATLAALVANLSASALAALRVASYSQDSTAANLIITYNEAGTAGNAYTLAASAATPSGGTLTGGAGAGTAGAKASGSLEFVLGNPTAAQDIVLDGVTWTFVAAGAVGPQTNIQVDLATTLTQLAIDLTASANVNISAATYSADATHLLIQYGIVGLVGNSYALDGGTAGATASATTLLGGAAAAGVPTATLDVGPESGTYPGVNNYFQQRRFYANSLNNPDTFWASQTGLYKNFDTSIPTTSTDAITGSPWTEQVNGIQWLVPMPGGLIAMTGKRAWQINGEGGSGLNPTPITPTTAQGQPQAFNGCSATIPPLVIDFEVIYVQAIGASTVYDLSWNFWVNIYTGADLTILSSHLFLGRQIVQWCWARQPYKVIWACCDDGILLSLTYLKEQEVYGWARHDTLGLVVSVASITEPPVDAVYAIVERFLPSATGGTGTFIMTAEENYDPANVALINAATPPLILYADQQECGLSYNFLRRELTYVAVVADDFSSTNDTGTTLWDGLRLVAPGDAVDTFESWNLQFGKKNIDTNAVTFTSYYSAANKVPNGIGPYAHGFLRKNSQPTNGQNIVINGTVWTFVTGAAGANQTHIQATLRLTYLQLALDLNGSADVNISQAWYQGGGAFGDGELVVNYKTGGVGGNAFTLNGGTYGATRSAATLAGGAAASDGTWQRMSADIQGTGGNFPCIVNPHNNDIWTRALSCNIYLARAADNFTQILSPLRPVYSTSDEIMPVGITANWFYGFEYQPGAFGSTVLVLYLVPSTIQAEETALDQLLAYAIFDFPTAITTSYFRYCLDHAGNFYVISGQAAGGKDFKFYKFTPPSSAPWGGPIVGGGFTDITPWGGGTGPNTNIGAYTFDAGGAVYPDPLSRNFLYFLPDTQDFVAITKNIYQETGEATNTYDFASTFYDCTYINVAGAPSFDFHSAFVTGFMSSDWQTTDQAGAAYAVVSCREFNLYLGYSDYLYDTDYTTRWMQFHVQPVAAGVVDTDIEHQKAVLVQYQFQSGSAPQVLQVIDEVGWDDAYPDYGQFIEDNIGITADPVPVVYNSMVYSQDSGTFDDAAIDDNGLYDETTNAFWWSGQEINGNMYGLDPAFLPRLDLNYEQTGPTPPFLKLTFGSGSSISGAYYMERMDDRLWSSVEDAYAVDAGVSNPLTAPASAIRASAVSGDGVSFIADSAVFTADMVGQVLRMSGGIALITGFTNTTNITGNWSLAATVGPTGFAYAAPGYWTVGSQIESLRALHLKGMTLVGLADGVPLAGLTVQDDGTVALPFAASNAKVGLPFTAQLQTPYLNGQQVTQGARKVIPAATVRVAASASFQTGTNQPDGGAQNPQQLAPPWPGMATADISKPTGGQSPPTPYTSVGGRTVTPLWTGDLRVVGGNNASWVSKGQVAIQQTLPMALEVVAVMPEILDGDIAERGYSPKQQDAGQSQNGGRQGPGGPGTRMLKI